MKARIIVVFAFVALISACRAQTIQGVINAVTGSGGGTTLSNDEIIKGLKEALNVGTNNSVASASKVDGFFKNADIKIPWPSDAAEMETKLRKLGFGNDVDKVVETLNRGAEEASKSAGKIFLSAISDLTISDGLKILKGENNAATTYLKTNTETSLRTTFKPIVHDALVKVELTKYWNPLAKTYNKIPFVTQVNPDLDAYVTQKAIDGLFKLIAGEELKIRTDPVARISDILKKVFGGE